MEEEPVKCHGWCKACGWKSGVGFWFGDRCWLMAAGQGCSIVPLLWRRAMRRKDGCSWDPSCFWCPARAPTVWELPHWPFLVHYLHPLVQEGPSSRWVIGLFKQLPASKHLPSRGAETFCSETCLAKFPSVLSCCPLIQHCDISGAPPEITFLPHGALDVLSKPNLHQDSLALAVSSLVLG